MKLSIDGFDLETDDFPGSQDVVDTFLNAVETPWDAELWNPVNEMGAYLLDKMGFDIKVGDQFYHVIGGFEMGTLKQKNEDGWFDVVLDSDIFELLGELADLAQK